MKAKMDKFNWENSNGQELNSSHFHIIVPSSGKQGNLDLGVSIINFNVTYYSTQSQAVVAHLPSLVQQPSGNISMPDRNSAEKEVT